MTTHYAFGNTAQMDSMFKNLETAKAGVHTLTAEFCDFARNNPEMSDKLIDRLLNCANMLADAHDASFISSQRWAVALASIFNLPVDKSPYVERIFTSVHRFAFAKLPFEFREYRDQLREQAAHLAQTTPKKWPALTA